MRLTRRNKTCCIKIRANFALSRLHHAHFKAATSSAVISFSLCSSFTRGAIYLYVLYFFNKHHWLRLRHLWNSVNKPDNKQTKWAKYVNSPHWLEDTGPEQRFSFPLTDGRRTEWTHCTVRHICLSVKNQIPEGLFDFIKNVMTLFTIKARFGFETFNYCNKVGLFKRYENCKEGNCLGFCN